MRFLNHFWNSHENLKLISEREVKSHANITMIFTKVTKSSLRVFQIRERLMNNCFPNGLVIDVFFTFLFKLVYYDHLHILVDSLIMNSNSIRICSLFLLIRLELFKSVDWKMYFIWDIYNIWNICLGIYFFLSFFTMLELLL